MIGFVIVVIVESNATATKNEAASKKNGTNTPIAIKKLPRGGPIKLFVSDSADHIWPFAFSSCSSFTTDGIKVWAVLSRKTSAQPKRKEAVIATIYSGQLVARLVILVSSFNFGSESAFQ